MTDVTEPDFLTVQEAARLLGVSRMTFWRRQREGALPVYESPANRRIKLVRRRDVEALLRPVLSATPVVKSEGDRNGK